MLTVFCSSTSGCFYRRLLTLKKQLKEFDDYFVLQEEEAISLICKKPVVLAKDTTRFMGTKPSAILGESPNAIYEYRMIKQYAQNQHETGNYALVQDQIERIISE